MLDLIPRPVAVVPSPQIEIRPAQVSCMRVAVLVAGEFEIDPAAMTGPTRGSPATALARQIAMYLAHVELGLDHTSIGICFGRDRTTVAHACRVVEDKRDDVRFDCRMATLELSFHGGDIR